jgi:DNA polymerase V
MIALIDVNSCYAACEQIFRPDLRGRPVVVLSNNDGTIVTLTKEAKQLGIQKFSPFFQVKDFCEMHNVAVFSSNYELYGDISNRVMMTIADEVPDISQYSIDEAFADLSNLKGVDLRQKGMQIKNRLWREVRMPVCVGIAQTKTLAKLGNRIAKDHPESNGVCCLDKPNQINQWLKRTPVGDVWGIGRQLSRRLIHDGIHNAFDLANANKKTIRRMYSVAVERTARELAGEQCFEFHESIANKKQIVVSRSFGKKVESLQELHESFADYACKAMVKLRSQNGTVKTLIISAHASRFSGESTSLHHAIKLESHTNSTIKVLNAINSVLPAIYRSGVRYAKAMVCLIELSEKRNQQLDMLCDQDSKRSERLMALVDGLNANGAGRVSIGRQGIGKEWSMKRKLLSHRYTTSWKEIPVINCY